MFTGIVEETGVVASVEASDDSRRLQITAGKVLDNIEVGDSIAINGVCLTVTSRSSDHVDVIAVGETLGRTNLGGLDEGHRVNLERPMKADGRFEGHIVQGHIDGAVTILSIKEEGDSRRIGLTLDPGLGRYLVEKGSVTLDGVSLTVTAVGSDDFEVVLIPHTLESTVWGDRHVGDVVNLEVDVLAKYVERLAGSQL
jgi:riboflavin synthase